MEPIMKIDNNLSPCCIEAIEENIAFNGMMACSKCKRIIKLFKNESDLKKFLVFCDAKKRDYKVARYKDYYVIAYISL